MNDDLFNEQETRLLVREHMIKNLMAANLENIDNGINEQANEAQFAAHRNALNVVRQQLKELQHRRF